MVILFHIIVTIYVAILYWNNLTQENRFGHLKNSFPPMAADVSHSSNMWQYLCPEAIRKGPR